MKKKNSRHFGVLAVERRAEPRKFTRPWKCVVSLVRRRRALSRRLLCATGRPSRGGEISLFSFESLRERAHVNNAFEKRGCFLFACSPGRDARLTFISTETTLSVRRERISRMIRFCEPGPPDDLLEQKHAEPLAFHLSIFVEACLGEALRIH